MITEKNDPYDSRLVLFGVLNDDCLSGLLGLVPAYVLRLYSLQCVRA